MASANYYRTFSFLGIRSASFQGNVLTIGTGVGILMFYDLRAGKYLESSINSSRTVHLKASKGWVVSFYTLLTVRTLYWSSWYYYQLSWQTFYWFSLIRPDWGSTVAGLDSSLLLWEWNIAWWIVTIFFLNRQWLISDTHSDISIVKFTQFKSHSISLRQTNKRTDTIKNFKFLQHHF